MGACFACLIFKKKKEKLYSVPNNFFEITVDNIDENEVKLNQFKNQYKAFLIVNVASA